MRATTSVAAIGRDSAGLTRVNRSGSMPRLAHEAEHLVAQRNELRVGIERLPIPPLACDRHRDDLLDPAGAGGEHRDAVAEEHRLFDAVRNEQNSELRLRPDADELFLERHAG